MEREFAVGLDCVGLTCNFKLSSCSAYVGELKDLMAGLEGCVVEHDAGSC